MRKGFFTFLVIASIMTTIVSCSSGGKSTIQPLEKPIDAVAVDLGLPSGTKWANMNVGASKPDNPGEYFAWGETNTKDNYDLQSYAHYRNGALQDIGENCWNGIRCGSHEMGWKMAYAYRTAV